MISKLYGFGAGIKGVGMLLWFFSFHVNNSVGCKRGSWESVVLTRAVAEPVLFTVLSDLHR